jgi:hypothetical protein
LLSNPQPLTANEIQELLSDDEALVLFSAGNKETYVFGLTHDASEWRAIPLGIAAPSEKVAEFRQGLDVDW